jgi:GNAT superfamily N-acetyltransferase
MAAQKGSWNQMFIDTGNDKPGIISTKEPVKPCLPNGKYKIKTPVPLSQLHIDFMQFHFINRAGTCNMVDSTLEKIFSHSVFECRFYTDEKDDDGILVGMIMTFPHRINLKISTQSITFNNITDVKTEETTLENKSNYETIKSSLTTHLCVHRDHRDQGIAMALIRSVIEVGRTKFQIFTGYHFFADHRTAAAIDVRPWFRVLNPIAASKYKYELNYVKTSNKVTNTALRLAYKISGKVVDIEATQRTHFGLLIKRKLSVTPFNELEWSRYTSADLTWVSLFKPNTKILLGVCMYRPFSLVTVDGIAKSAQISYFEITNECQDDDLEKMLRTVLIEINKAGYIAVHGSMMGPLSNEQILIKNKVTIFDPKNMYLDFYNIATSKDLTAADVSVLYI